MGPGALSEAIARTVLATGEVSDAEIQQRLKEDFVKPFLEYADLGHPVMRPEAGFIQFVCITLFSNSSLPFFSVNLFGCGNFSGNA